MNPLKEYLFYKDESITSFASRVGISRAYTNQIVKGKVIPGRLLAQEIERKTDGEVKAEDLMNFKKEDQNQVENKDI